MNRGLTRRSFRNIAATEYLGDWSRRADAARSATSWGSIVQALKNCGDRVLNAFVRRLDAYLRRIQGIIEFTSDPQCLLRISARRARGGERLPGGRVAIKGEWIGLLHLWNEHIPPLPHGGADLKWALTLRRQMRRSFVLLAEFAQVDRRYSRIPVFCGETAFAPGKLIEKAGGLADHFGIEVTENRRPEGFFGWWARLGEAIYLWGMIRTFNRNGLRPRSLMKPVWFQFWMTRETLLKKYGALRVPEERFETAEIETQPGRQAA